MTETQFRVRQKCEHPREFSVGGLSVGIPEGCFACGGTGWLESWISPGEFLRLVEHETGRRILTEVVK